MSASTFVNFRDVDDIYNLIVNYMQKGYVQVDLETFTFTQGVTDYTLDNSYLISISQIEGIDDEGNAIPPTGSYNNVSALVDGVDFNLYGDAGTDEDGVQLYSGIRFTDSQLFENESTVYVTYVYYDADQKTNVTNFNTGSVAGMIAKAMAIQLANVYNINERLYNAGSVATATGIDLENHGEIYGVSRNEGSPASGTVLVTVSASGSDLTITTATAMVASVAGESLIFNPTTGGTVTAGNSVEFEVVSNSNGYKYNIGANSITKIYQTNSLFTELTGSTVTVNNNSVKLNGNLNQFTGGTDRENDKSYRDRIYNEANKLGRGTLRSIKSALENLSIVSSVRVKDWHQNKEIANGVLNILAVSNTGYKLLTDTASLTTMNNTIDEYKPGGSSYSITHPMAVMIDFSGTVVIDDDDLDDVTTIKTNIQSGITNYINNLGIGEDVLYAEIIATAMNIGGVYDFNVNTLNYTEFATNPIALDTTTMRVSDNEDGGGTAYKAFYQEVKFLPTGRTDVWIYSGAQVFDTEYTPVITTFEPAVYIAIDGGNGTYVRDPAYTFDFYSGVIGGQVQIDENAGSGVNRTLVSGVDKLIFFYHTAETDTINGVRVKLHAKIDPASSGTVKMEFWSGVSSPTGGSLLESGSITVVSGTADYEVLFSSPLTVGDPEVEYYVLLSGTSAMVSGTYVTVPISASGTAGAQSTNIYSGNTVEILSGSWGIIPNASAMVHTIIYGSGTNDIDIEGTGNIPDIAVVYDIDIGHVLKSAVEQDG